MAAIEEGAGAVIDEAVEVDEAVEDVAALCGVLDEGEGGLEPLDGARVGVGDVEVFGGFDGVLEGAGGVGAAEEVVGEGFGLDRLAELSLIFEPFPDNTVEVLELSRGDEVLERGGVEVGG